MYMKTEICYLLHIKQHDNSDFVLIRTFFATFLINKYNRNMAHNIYINSIQCIKINYKNSILVS